MSDQTYCTIITSDYFFYAKALFDSLKKYNNTINFQVLIVDGYDEAYSYDTIDVISLEEIKTNLASDYDSIRKYEEDKKSNLRWALKPLFLKYLIKLRGFQKVLFLDPDLYFYQTPEFLFDELNTADVIITPHWRSKDPNKDKSNFDLLFTGGLYNAGFFGCNENALNILDWWLLVCAYKMQKTNGFYVDQAYLNLIPIYFSSQVKILEHKGCNVSNWNLIECERTKNGEEILINNKYPIIFIHFTNATINMIANGKDKLLLPFLEHYKSGLLLHNKAFQFNFEEDNPKRKEPMRFSLKKIFKL